MNTRAPCAAHMAAALGVDLLTEGPALVTVAGGVAAAPVKFIIITWHVNTCYITSLSLAYFPLLSPGC